MHSRVQKGVEEVKKTIIELKNVKKVYRMGAVEVPALGGVSTDIKQKEFVAIMGPSGSGKSTLMNMVGCLDTPTSGSVFLNGQDISLLGESDLAQIRGKMIGFVFQQFNLIATLSALENVSLPALFQDVSRDERIGRAKKILTSLGLGERMHHKPTELSGGEQQRVAIARALMNDPDVVLADEPTGNLDSKTGAEIMKTLKELHEKEGKTVIMVTHDANLARLADRTIRIRDGLIVKS